jgi:two-component system, chemotaxis family, sensor kinase Cph1
VLANLVSNAIKYADPDKPERWVAFAAQERPTPASPQAPQPAFVVRDNGIGIREKHLETIFKLFKRLHRQDAFGGGTGAGLTIAQKRVDLHGGVIWAESAPGEGTSMWFTLAPPASPPERPDGAAILSP